MVRTCTNFHRHSPSESMHRNTRIVQPGPQSFVSRPTTGPGGAFVFGGSEGGARVARQLAPRAGRI